MNRIQEIITAGNLAFLKIASAKVFRNNREYQVLIEALKHQLGDSHTRNTHVYIWECEDIPPDCSAIVMVRPEDAKAIKALHGKRERLRGFARSQLSEKAK